VAIRGAIYPYDVATSSSSRRATEEHDPSEFDLRKVDQFAFLELLTDESKRREPDRFDPYSSSYLPTGSSEDAVQTDRTLPN
jgi:hypothetical protein